MSTFEVKVVPFTLNKHPNADVLSIAQIKGWQAIVKTSDFENETLGVYVPLDAIAKKEHPLLSFMEGKKVKTIKLRKAISQGILLPFTQVQQYINSTHGEVFPAVGEGDDLKDLLEITKWEPPFESNLESGSGFRLPEQMQKYTDIENIKNFPDSIPFGEEVSITEKLHGTSARFGLIDGKFYIGSRNRGIRTENFVDAEGKDVEFKKSTWNHVAEREKLEDKVRKISELFADRNVVLYGEIVGSRIQDLNYGASEPKFYAYDLAVMDESQSPMYIIPGAFREIMKKFDVDAIPLLKVGLFIQEDYELRNGSSTLGKHCREGIVIEPVISRKEYSLGRVILKLIGEDYLLRKNATDN